MVFRRRDRQYRGSHGGVLIATENTLKVHQETIESLSFAFKRETANARQRKKVNIGGKEQLNYRLFKTLLYNQNQDLRKKI